MTKEQGMWSAAQDVVLDWHSFDAANESSHPGDGSQVWVDLDNGIAGPAVFHAQPLPTFVFVGAPAEAESEDVIQWAYNLRTSTRNSLLDRSTGLIEDRAIKGRPDRH